MGDALIGAVLAGHHACRGGGVIVDVGVTGHARGPCVQVRVAELDAAVLQDGHGYAAAVESPPVVHNVGLLRRFGRVHQVPVLVGTIDHVHVGPLGQRQDLRLGQLDVDQWRVGADVRGLNALRGQVGQQRRLHGGHLCFHMGQVGLLRGLEGSAPLGLLGLDGRHPRRYGLAVPGCCLFFGGAREGRLCERQLCIALPDGRWLVFQRWTVEGGHLSGLEPDSDGQQLTIRHRLQPVGQVRMQPSIALLVGSALCVARLLQAVHPAIAIDDQAGYLPGRCVDDFGLVQCQAGQRKRHRLQRADLEPVQGNVLFVSHPLKDAAF